jgi:predicted cupin superfamily sugar epimerase
MLAHHTDHDANFWIETLALTHHPEGGWFAESYRSVESIAAEALPNRFHGERSFCTSIYFLLERSDFSALHRIKSDEIWHFYDGAPLKVVVITPAGELHEILLGRDAVQGQRLQAVVPAGCWFGAECCGAYSLVGCTVSPGFDFSDFEMAEQSHLSNQYPQHGQLISRMTRI